MLSEVYFANRIALVFIFLSFLLLLIPFLIRGNRSRLWASFITPFKDSSLVNQSQANSSFHLKSPLYLLIIIPLILPILISQIRNLYWLLHNQLPVGALTPDAQFAIGFANHILLSRDTSSFNVDGITTPFYTGVFTTLATFNYLSPMNDKFDLIFFSWISSTALFLALFRLGKVIFPEIIKTKILLAALIPFSLSAWPFTKNRNDVGAQSIGVPELIPSTTLAIFLFVSCLIKLVEFKEFCRIKQSLFSPLMITLYLVPLGMNILAISCLKPSIGYVTLTFFCIYGISTTKILGLNVLSYTCFLLSASLLASIRCIFPSAEGVSFDFLSNLRLLFSPFVVFTFVSMLIALFLKIHHYKRHILFDALQINAVIWSCFVVNSQFAAQGRNTIYGLIPLILAALLPLCVLGIISALDCSADSVNALSLIPYLYLCAALFYWFFEYSPLKQALPNSPGMRRLILLSLFILLLIFVFFTIFLKNGKMAWDSQFLLNVLLLVMVVLGTSNYKNTYNIWDFRSDEVKSQQGYIPNYVERERELRQIAEILKVKNIEKYATNSWCRYIPNKMFRITLEPYGCDTRAFEVSSIIVGTPRLGGWSYDYKYGRNQSNDEYIEEQIALHDRLWKAEDISEFWSKLGASALILDREMPLPKVNIAKFIKFESAHFILYIKK